MSSILQEPLKVGALELKNRIVMAPLTRSRASGTDDRTPNALLQEYYTQRASAGLIISEATSVTPMGVGYAKTPGIWSDEQTQAWKKVTESVHEKGGKIVLQLWHVGRISHSLFLKGEFPVAPSAIRPSGHVSLVRPTTEYETPRALRLDELPGVIEAYRKGAVNAVAAGFDGVEIHGANGYLLDQFLQDGSNHRTDRYGGSIGNRARLLLEVTDAVVSVWGADRVGVHLSPRGGMSSMSDSNPEALFTYVAKELGQRKIAFICTREFEGPDSLSPKMKKLFGGVFISNEKFTLESAEAIIKRGDADAIAFGRLFIANPDLPKRFATRAPLNPERQETFYAGGAEGYTDYPSLP